MKAKILAALFGLPALSAFGAEVDLSTWTVQDFSPGAGNWVVQSGNTSVIQTINGNPTVFLSDLSALGTAIQGKIKPLRDGDDDYIGFVLGFSPGDFASPTADYLLIDWKQNDQDVADAGLAVSRVTGSTSDALNFWGHTGIVTELARGATLSDTGFVDNTEYTFAFVFTPTNLQVSVDGVLQLNISGSFSGGNLGFYNYSQANVQYSGFTRDVIPPTGVPDGGASIALLSLSLIGLGMCMRRRKR